MGKYLDELKAQRSRAAATETRPRPTRGGTSRVAGLGGFLIGAADTMTFGYADEILATADSVILGKDRDAQLGYWRNALSGAQRDQFGWTLAGQLGGAVTGGVGALKAFQGLKGAKGMATLGAAEGALYGSGSANGDFGDRLSGAVIGGGLGAGAGWMLGKYVLPGAEFGLKQAATLTRWGRTPKLTTKFAPAAAVVDDKADDVVELGKELRTGQTAAQRAKVNSLTGKSGDEVEDGALFSMKELLGEPGAARAALEKRLGKLSAVEAQHLATRIEKAMVDGSQIDDPHFRSLLGFDIDDPDVDADTVMKAISIMEDGIDAVLQKAGAGTRSNASVQHEVQERLKQGVLMKDLEEALDRSKAGVADQVVAQHAELYAGVQFVRAKDKFLPKIKAGEEGAREALAEALTKSAHIMAMARGIGSNSGRALQVRKAGGTGKIGNIGDDVFEMESIDEIRNRVNGALKELGDDELTDLIAHLRTADDIGRVNEILTDAEQARQWGAYKRTMNSLGSWLRSNALTPATGLFNTISFIGHDFFRNGMAKRWAARNFERAGKTDDALALRFEAEVGRRVYAEAHKRGIKAMLARVDWEGWKSVEKIAGTLSADNALLRKARLAQSTMLQDGFRAPDLREFKPKPGIGITDVGAFNEAMDAATNQGGALARLISATRRAGAFAATAVDEAGQASMKLFTGAVDDYGRQFVTLKETYALSARYAIREAMELGLPPKEMLAHAQKRAVELAEMPPTDILRRVEMKLADEGSLDGEPDLQFLMDRSRAVELEADRTLLMDGPQTSFGKLSAGWLRKLDKGVGLGQVEGVLLPYINTPVRILERGLVSYTPFAKQAEETVAILKKGGVEAEIERARIELGTMGIWLGAALGSLGGLTLTNGGFTNSAGLDAGPPNRINIPGGGFVEIGRLDPFALTLAMGAMWGQAVNAGYHAYDEYKTVQEGFDAFVQTAFFAAKDAVFEKSYLTSLQDLMEIIGARDEGGAGRKLEKFLHGVFSRVPPVAGTAKQVTESIMGYSPETITMGDAILRGIPGGSMYLSPRRDVLGDEIKGRTMGIAFGDSSSTEGEEITPVKAKLRELGIDLTNMSKVDGGIALTSEQVSELRRVRGKEATNAEGLLMQEALEELFQDPAFLAGSKDDRHDAVVDLLNDFNEEAKAILEERDPNYLAVRTGNRAFREYVNSGIGQDEARGLAREDVLSSGLPDPQL